jgi:prevent-host-death family protein
MKSTYSISEAQAHLPELCRSGERVIITKRAEPVAVLLPVTDYEALRETMDLLANPTAVKTLRAARAGKLSYKRLDLTDEALGL